MLCYIVLISAIYQHESAIGICMSSLSWTSLPWTTPSCHSRLSQWFCCFVDDIFCCCCVKAFQFVIFPFIFVFVSCLRRHVVVVVVVELLSHVQLFATPPTGAHQASLSFTISWNLLKLICIESVYHPTISSSVLAFSSCLQSFSASASFPESQFFASGGQSIGASASASVPPMNIQDWFPFRTERFDLLAV